MMDLRSGYVEVEGGSLYYEVMGEGHPLVLIHAGISDRRMWDEQFPLFARHYSVLRFDVRGFGRSPLPTSGTFSVIDDLHELLDALEIETAALVGVSMGGGVAVSFAIAHPQMVGALVPVASALSGFPDTDARRQRWARRDEVIRRGGRDEAVNLMMELWADGVRGQAPPEVRRRVGEIFSENVEMLFRADVPERDAPWKAIDRLEEIRAPTLVIVGDRDQPDILAIADTLAERIPRARKVVIQDTAHMVSMEQPAQFNRLVLDFLEETVGREPVRN